LRCTINSKLSHTSFDSIDQSGAIDQSDHSEPLPISLQCQFISSLFRYKFQTTFNARKNLIKHQIFEMDHLKDNHVKILFSLNKEKKEIELKRYA